VPAPLCPAGHLPLGWGDRLGPGSPLYIEHLILRAVRLCEVCWEATVPPLVISPPEGEMPGRAEGGRHGTPHLIQHLYPNRQTVVFFTSESSSARVTGTSYVASCSSLSFGR